MKRKMIVLLIVTGLLLSMTACGASLPKGFDEVMSFEQDGNTITQYLGKSSLDDARDDFDKWAKRSGWSELKNGPGFSMSGYVGLVYEKRKDKMSITIMDAGDGQIVVTIVEGDEAH